MSRCVYLGDEVSAAGYRLAGAAVRIPAPVEAGAALKEACKQAELVLLSARLAAAIGERTLRAALSATSPLLLVVPDVDDDVPVPDLAARLQAQLGLEA